MQLLELEPRAVPAAWSPLSPAGRYFVTGADAGLSPVVRIYDADAGTPLDEFPAYAADFTGGVRVALGDVTGDGVPDIVTGPGAGGGPDVRVFSGTDGTLVRSFFAYESTFRGGAYVAVADLTGDGRGEIVVGAGVGGGPRVRVFGESAAAVRDFFAYESTFRGGVTVAAGDFGDAIGPAVVAGSGPGGGPAVRVFRYANTELAASFFAYDSAQRGGVFVAAGDLDGDGRADVVTGPGDGSPEVKVFDPAEAKEKLAFAAGGTGLGGGVRVGVVKPTADGLARIVTGNGPGAPAAVRLYDNLDGNDGRTEPAGDAGNLFGVSVGG